MNVSTQLGEPIPVALVKPEVKTSIVVAQLIATIAGLFLSTWLLWLIIPVVTPWTLGFWQTMLLYIGSNILIKTPNRIINRFSDLKGK